MSTSSVFFCANIYFINIINISDKYKCRYKSINAHIFKLLQSFSALITEKEKKLPSRLKELLAKFHAKWYTV